MLKKKILAIMLVVLVLLLSFSGCGQGTEGKNGSLEENSSEESSFRENFGDEESRKSLNVCIDMGINIYATDEVLIRTMNKISNDIKAATGFEEVSIQCLPAEGAERESALSRVKTEVMSGGGPDVFIVCAVGSGGNGDTPNALFNFPQKNMEAGLFLPLDEYIENNTQYTDWSKQTKVIMDAGRTAEGQVVVPTTYTLPIFVYPKNKMNLIPSSSLTMQDILNDLDNATLAAVLYSAFERDYDDPESYPLNTKHLAYVLGQLADFENEELLFTEEELLSTVDMMTAMYDQVNDIEFQFFAEDVGYPLFQEMALAYYDTEMSLVPIYSMDGGVTASITSFAAVNRNTKYPEESFAVIDYLMQEKIQSSSNLYRFVLYEGIPLQDDLCQEEKPIGAVADPARYFSAEQFEEFSAIKSQITAVNFRNELDLILEETLDTTAIDYFTTGKYDLSTVPEAYAKMERMIGE